MRERLQSFGGFLAGMIIPNMGAFIAWGLITALFIPTGWIPNETFAKVVGPMIVNSCARRQGCDIGQERHAAQGLVVFRTTVLGVTKMLETIAILLVILWALGLVSSYTMGGFIHILLVVAIVVIVLRLIQGRRV